MKMVEIRKQYTEKVNQYLNEGWIINPESMSGHQGEIAKIDVVKDNVLVRIWLERESKWSFNEDAEFNGNMIVLRVGKWNRPAVDAEWATVWFKEFEVLSEKIFYEVGRHSKWYVDSFDEAMEAQRKNFGRYKTPSRDRKDVTSEKTQEIASKYLKDHEGYQRVSRDHIKITRITECGEKTKYRVTYHGGVYYIK